MTIQIQDIDKEVLKSVFTQILVERKDLFKEIVKEVLFENEAMVNSEESVLSEKRKAILQKIMKEDKELLQMLAQ